MQDRFIYRICRADEWAAAEAAGRYEGAAHDRADGFIHFSTAGQVAETAARHYSGQDGLVLLKVRTANLGAALKWEMSPSRGEAFPHLYAPLPAAEVVGATALPLGPDGKHVLPPLE